ncbi:hypothetical protein BJX70DRAFT_407687 [Aspergillus crustosus]
MENYTITRANPSVSLYTYIPTHPTKPSTPRSSNSPPLVLLLPWMGATKRQTESYIRGHITLFASAPPNFLVIYSGITEFVSLPQLTGNDDNRRLQPALTVLSDYDPDSILVHILSNGGVRVFANLARVFKQQHNNNKAFKDRIIATRFAIDSAPGRLTYTETMLAVSAALPSSQPLIKYPLYTLLAAVLAVYLGLGNTLGWDDPLRVAAENLNDVGVDRIVKGEFVEGHAAEARGKGLGVVEMEVFEGSAHVWHVRLDGEKYWGAVARL